MRASHADEAGIVLALFVRVCVCPL